MLSRLEQRKAEPYIWDAIEALLKDGTTYNFGNALQYEVVLEDGSRLPSKAVFGKALSLARNEEIYPRHFVGGKDSVCVEILKKCGVKVIDKRTGRPI